MGDDAVVIRRYANRKMYDTERRGYVTHAQIVEMRNGGRAVRIIDYETGADITKTTMPVIMATDPASIAFALSGDRPTISWASFGTNVDAATARVMALRTSIATAVAQLDVVMNESAAAMSDLENLLQELPDMPAKSAGSQNGDAF